MFISNILLFEIIRKVTCCFVTTTTTGTTKPFPIQLGPIIECNLARWLYRRIDRKVLDWLTTWHQPCLWIAPRNLECAKWQAGEGIPQKCENEERGWGEVRANEERRVMERLLDNNDTTATANTNTNTRVNINLIEISTSFPLYSSPSITLPLLLILLFLYPKNSNNPEVHLLGSGPMIHLRHLLFSDVIFDVKPSLSKPWNSGPNSPTFPFYSVLCHPSPPQGSSWHMPKPWQPMFCDFSSVGVVTIYFVIILMKQRGE